MKKFMFFKRCVSFVLSLAVFSCLFSTSVVLAEKRGNLNYFSNQGELLETPFVSLPLGSVKARSWLENQLLLQKNGLTGHMRFFNEYNEDSSAWLGKSSGEAWERGPYYMRGLVALAFVLDDEELIDEAMKWINWSINSQVSSGYFGTADNSWWPRMPVLMAIRDYYEVTEANGTPDLRVLSFMENYFRYQAAQLPSRPLSNWADARGGDNIDSVYWLYNRLYDENDPQASKWLLDLGTLLLSQTNNWTSIYNDSTVRYHVVNTSQGMKTPPVYYQFAKSDNYYTALKNGLLNMSIDHGRIDALPNSDEAARDNRSTRGTETCGVVEGLLSTEIATRIFGEAWLGDRIEKLAYNALPATMTPDSTGHTYYVLQNQVMATLGNHEFDCDHGDSSAFGAPLGFDCCFSNYHMGWPKFVQNMWMATKNNGLAIVAYGPNSVTAKVADGKTAKFLQDTDYPFKDSVKLSYAGDSAEFELLLRIPEWCSNASVRVNGELQSSVVSGEYFVVDRLWNSGDVVELVFPSEIQTSTWYNDSVAVEKGALIYGLKIEEDWRTTDSNAARELKVANRDGFPLREVYAASPWNYGLIVDRENPASSFSVVTDDVVALQPFSVDSAPVTLKAKGQLIPDWVLDGNIAGPQPFGPTAYDESLVRDIELIPYGSGRLRITHFPKIGDAQDTVVRTSALDGKFIEHNGKEFLEFKNVVVPTAADYTLKIIGSGIGNVLINAKYSTPVVFSGGVATISNLKSKLTGYFAFNAKQYNNIRFDKSLNIESIEVIPVNREIDSIAIRSFSRSGDSFKITTNLDAQETPYKVIYGTTPGVYTSTLRGMESSTATVTGIDKTKNYYAKVVTSINGQQVSSDEIVLNATSGGGGLKPNPNVPSAVYSGFSTINYMPDEWQRFDPENKIVFDNSSGSTQINLGKGTRVKTVLQIDGADNWVDYVVEAEISVDVSDTNNCGIMFRASNIGNDPDAYNGYFVGIGHLAVNKINGENKRYDGPGLMIGYADGAWHDLDPLSMDISPGQKYILKIVAYGDNFAVYLDNQLVTTFVDDKFAKGTVGLRSYNEAFKAYDFKVRPVTEDDLLVFMPEDTGLQPNKDAPDASYSGLGSVTDVNANWTKFDPSGLINVVDNAGNAQINLGRGTQVKTVLTNASTDPFSWTDYVVEAKLSVDLVNNNNCGLMIRSTGVGNGPDAYSGYFVGIGHLGVNKIDGVNERYDGPGLMIGYAENNSWNDLYPMRADIKANQIYTLKVVTYSEGFAVYIDDVLMKVIEDSRFSKGTIGLRSYNEAFKVYDVSVRNVVKGDLDVFEVEEEPEPLDPPDFNHPNFVDDFSDVERSNSLWTKVGNTGLISINQGNISLGSSNNVKATAGDDSWYNYVYEADITLNSGSGNAGLIFKTTREGSGADNYYGYYFGITSSSTFEIGKASNNWTQLATGACQLNSGANRLKIIDYKGTMLFYINDKLVHNMTDLTHTAGKIGVRGYNKDFTATNILVRPLTPSEFDFISKPITIPIDIEAESCYNIIQVIYPKISNATSFKVQFGKQSGVYTDEFVDVKFNSYKGGGIFTADKVAFTVPEPGTYYVRFVSLNGSTELGYSNELKVDTGFIKDVSLDKAVLSNTLSVANSTDTSQFSNISLNRLNKATQLANSVLNTANANQMDLNLANCLLNVALTNTSSTDIFDVISTDIEALISLSKVETSAVANFEITNSSDEDIKVALILAVYNDSNELIDTRFEESIVNKNSNAISSLSIDVTPGNTVKAFAWRMEYNEFTGDYIPLTYAAQLEI